MFTVTTNVTMCVPPLEYEYEYEYHGSSGQHGHVMSCLSTCGAPTCANHHLSRSEENQGTIHKLILITTVTIRYYHSYNN